MSDQMTLGHLVERVLLVDNDDEARRCFAGYVELLTTKSKLLRPEAERVARSNIGWCFGEGMSDERIAMWVRVCGASHPIFGRYFPRPTFEQALQAGIDLGNRMRERATNRDLPTADDLPV